MPYGQKVLILPVNTVPKDMGSNIKSFFLDAYRPVSKYDLIIIKEHSYVICDIEPHVNKTHNTYCIVAPDTTVIEIICKKTNW